MEIPSADELKIRTLGSCYVDSPLAGRQTFVADDQRIVTVAETQALLPLIEKGDPLPSFEAAGPRERIFFEPGELTCGIVTCGGLCPGLNDVIRSIVMTLTYAYGVRRVLGFRYGYAGISSNAKLPPMVLDPNTVDRIHQRGGTILGSSRGPQDVGDMVEQLEQNEVGLLFTIGGDGTLKGASALAAEIRRRALPIGVVGIPKTIDNDLVWTERSFGFATAVHEAQVALDSAHTEARGAWNGIGLVKLMGRYSGSIAANATLANGDVNFCLIPEIPLVLDGAGGLFEQLEARIRRRHHALIVVAEGTGQELFEANGDRDASGNVLLHDIGIYLRKRIKDHFHELELPVDLKYIDPSYMIRSRPASTVDSHYCLVLGQQAAHAGMAGRTDMMIGFWHHHFTHVPLALVAGRRRRVDPDGEVWQRVVQTTGQRGPLASHP